MLWKLLTRIEESSRADWQSAIQQAGSLRYDRFQVKDFCPLSFSGGDIMEKAMYGR